MPEEITGGAKGLPPICWVICVALVGTAGEAIEKQSIQLGASQNFLIITVVDLQVKMAD